MTLIPKNTPNITFTETLSSVISKNNIIEQYESLFSEITKTKYCLAFPYNRVAIYSFFKSLGIVNKEVIMPAYSCVVVANSIIKSKNIPIFADINLDDYNMNIDNILSKISNKTATIIPTHMYGNPLNIKPITEIFNNNLYILEDAALCTPGFYSDIIGKNSNGAIFSMDLNKHVFTVNGGMFVTNDKLIFEKMKKYRDDNFKKQSIKIFLVNILYILMYKIIFNHQIYGAFDKLRKKSKILKENTLAYTFGEILLNKNWDVNISKFQANIGIRQLTKINELDLHRITIDNIYYSELSNINEIVIPRETMHPKSHYTIRIPNRDKINFRERMYAVGIECGITLDYSLPELKMYSFLGQDGKCPNSNIAAKEIVNLPNHIGVNEKNANYISKTVRRILSETKCKS